MTAFWENFHWLRPLWLLAILPVLLLAYGLWQQRKHSSGWQQVISPELLEHLLEGVLPSKHRYSLIGLGLAWILCAIALAGPTWERLPQPVHQQESAMVVLFDLSPSMLAADLKPSRLVRARHQLIDILQARREGLTALIAYAGEAHVVAPLTDDTATLESLLPALHPNIMPLRGSNTEMAVDKALQLFTDSGISQGDILLVTDGVDNSAIDALVDRLDGGQFRLSTLAIGSVEGAPIPADNGGFARDNQGGIVIARVNHGQLQQLSQQLQGHYSSESNSPRLLQQLANPAAATENNSRQIERQFDSWADRGHWLVLLLLPVIVYSFRRGLVCPALLLCLVLPNLVSAPYAQAQAEISSPETAANPPSFWDDLWLTRDQQAQRQLQNGKPSAAAQIFEANNWRGSAAYQAQDYQAAAEAFATGEQAVDHYNRGNALAHAGKLPEAIEAYQQARQLDPEFDDAAHNQALVEELLRQQQQNQDQQEGQEGQQSEQDQKQQQDQNQNSQNNQQQDQQQGSSQQSQQDAGQKSEQEENTEPEQNKSQQADAEKAMEEEQTSVKENKQSDNEKQDAQQAEPQAMTAEEREQQQALEQWLRQVPDDPGGLLRNKFKHQYRQRRLEYQNGNWQPPENDAHKRW